MKLFYRNDQNNILKVFKKGKKFNLIAKRNKYLVGTSTKLVRTKSCCFEVGLCGIFWILFVEKIMIAMRQEIKKKRECETD